MTTHELNRAQLDELKISLFWQVYHNDDEIPAFVVKDETQPYTRETLPDYPHEIPDETIHKVYAGICFVPDDFSGSVNDAKTAPQDKRCPHCGGPLFLSDNPEYTYQCFDCDEDFYNIEVEKKK